MRNTLFTLVLSFFLLLSCSSSYDAGLLIGDWTTISWTVKATGKTINQKMDFNFQKEGMYSVDYGSEKEAGAYYLAGDFLHTKENGATDKSVVVTKLTKDTLIFQMNRAGSLEEVLLIKK